MELAAKGYNVPQMKFGAVASGDSGLRVYNIEFWYFLIIRHGVVKPGIRECCCKVRVITSWLADVVTELVHDDENYQTEEFTLLGQCLHLGWRSKSSLNTPT